MVQELTSISKRIAIIGGGPAGFACAKFLCNANLDITIFDEKNFLHTLLPTGGGRCNLANAQYDFKQLAKNYPRGEKFLYSVFAKFSTTDTIDFFKSIGVNTYIQEDNRIFPVANSSSFVRKKLLNSLKCQLVKEKIEYIETKDFGYILQSNKSKYYFDKVIVAIGGHSSFEFLKNLNINIIEPTSSLVGLITKEDFSLISGLSLKNIKARIDKKYFYGDIIFTHNGISGPLIYKISSIYARKNMPYKINFQFIENINLQDLMNSKPHKEIKNLLSEFIPKSLSEYMLKEIDINSHIPCHKINRQMRNQILESLTNYSVTITGKVPDSEIVTCGGIDLKEVNSKTMESKKYKGLYFCGEVLDIDGFCGGFNLQNCWSTAYVCANAIITE